MTITLNEQKKAKVKASYQAVQHYENFHHGADPVNWHTGL